MVEMIAHRIFGQPRRLRARQAVLGLALKLRVADKDRQHHLAAAQQVVGGDLRRLLLSDQLAESAPPLGRSEEHKSELQSLMRISYAVFCLKTKTIIQKHLRHLTHEN